MNMAVRDLMQLALPLTAMIFLYRRKSILNGSGDGKQQSSKKVIHSYPRWMKATPKLGVDLTKKWWGRLTNPPHVTLAPHAP